MRRTQLDPKILKRLKEKTKGKLSEHSIQPALSKIREKYDYLTLNAAAQIFAKEHGFTVSRYLKSEDRQSLQRIETTKIKIPLSRNKRGESVVTLVQYEAYPPDILLQAHLDEINRAYTYRCYTATFILCRKVLENLLVHHILKKKYPTKQEEHRKKYFDFERRRNLDFDKLLANLRSSAVDFIPENDLVQRICQLAEGFKPHANEMTHSLYHIAKKKEIDEKNIQEVLNLIARLEKNLTPES